MLKYIQIKYHTLNNQWTTEELKRKIHRYFEKKKTGNTVYQNIGWSKSSSKKGVYRNKGIYQEKRNTASEKPYLTLQGTMKKIKCKVIISKWRFQCKR